jgi:hypothetical protein
VFPHRPRYTAAPEASSRRNVHERYAYLQFQRVLDQHAALCQALPGLRFVPRTHSLAANDDSSAPVAFV